MRLLREIQEISRLATRRDGSRKRGEVIGAFRNSGGGGNQKFPANLWGFPLAKYKNHVYLGIKYRKQILGGYSSIPSTPGKYLLSAFAKGNTKVNFGEQSKFISCLPLRLS